MKPAMRKIWLSLLTCAFLLVLSVPLISLWLGGDKTRFPIRELKITSQFQNLTEDQIAALILPELKAGIVLLDLNALRARMLTNSWIEKVEIRRHWPETLALVVHERTAVARWGDTGLLNERGEVFEVSGAAQMTSLAKLSGPQIKRLEMLAFYQSADPALRELGIHITRARFSSRGGLSVKLSSGAEVIVGREDINARWQRLVEALPTLIGPENLRTGKQLKSVDLRYTNGMAITFNEPATAPTQAPRAAPILELPAEPSGAEPALPTRDNGALAVHLGGFVHAQE